MRRIQDKQILKWHAIFIRLIILSSYVLFYSIRVSNKYSFPGFLMPNNLSFLLALALGCTITFFFFLFFAYAGIDTELTIPSGFKCDSIVCILNKSILYDTQRLGFVCIGFIVEGDKLATKIFNV